MSTHNYFALFILLWMQLNFFRKGLKSLEAVEPHVRLVTEQQHIEYEFSGLEDDDDGIHNVQSGNGGNGERLDLVPMSRNSMEVRKKKSNL